MLLEGQSLELGYVFNAELMQVIYILQIQVKTLQ